MQLKLKLLFLNLVIVYFLIIIGCFSVIFTNKEIYKLRTQNSNGIGEVDSLDLTILCDNYPNEDLVCEWGFSVLIETNGLTVLLDTGQSYSGLRENSLDLNKDLSEVDYVVISHEHWDHIGGLSYIDEINPGVTVYVPEHMNSQTFNSINQSSLNAVKVNATTIIGDGFAVIGELYGPPYEQALAVNVKDVGLVCFVGCSHPGVENHVEKAIEDLGYNGYMVIGGFHMGAATQQVIQLKIDRLLELGVQKIYPTHCSGDPIRQYLASNYPLQYGLAYVGFQASVNIIAVNPLISLITVPLTVISLTIFIGWFQKKEINNSKRS
ncbi:MAG: MBL fold metallo-hydrolase [Promethearchaeota archaeon]|nr:MAG: MBL fold metallo-hydrolase [Candidatus Lokiarchaeota archaeon]